MWTSSCGVLSLIVFVAIASELEVIHRNGWTPVSSDIVYSQIIRGATHSPRYTKAEDVQTYNTFDTVTPDREFGEAEEHISNGDEIINCGIGDAENCITDNFKKEFNVKDEGFYPNTFKIPENYNSKADISVRRAKKLNKIHHILNRGALNERNNSKSKDVLGGFKSIKLKLDDVSIHNYEVTENNIVEKEPKYEETSSKKTDRIMYDPPKRQNFTDLFKYLSKYNINDSDNFQNYALSRRPKAEIPRKLNPVTKLFQFRVPIRYNSLNHLAVDPMLAVFLSNYGYYLQGQYGIQNNYNNLYGYLASNNIHNNRPFGFYKLFSDTDSSH